MTNLPYIYIIQSPRQTPGKLYGENHSRRREREAEREREKGVRARSNGASPRHSQLINYAEKFNRITMHILRQLRYASVFVRIHVV